MPQKAQVAQLVEQRTENPRVGGSNPPLGTILILFQMLINGLEKVGHCSLPWWDTHSYPSCSHFSIALAASFLWRAPLRVAINFFRGLMAGDCHDLSITRAKLCEPRRSGLAQTMRRTMRQSGQIPPTRSFSYCLTYWSGISAFNVACGRCRNCREQNTGVCLTVNDSRPGGAYGYVDMGGWIGGQARFVMVPYADFNLLKFPDRDKALAKIRDLTMLTDILPTGFHGAVSAKVGVGSTVYVAGAGPVGLAAAASARILGAAVVMIGDTTRSASRMRRKWALSRSI